MNTVYDQSILTELVGDTPETIISYQNEYIKQCMEILRALVTNFKQQDFKALKDNAHYLKTSAHAVGALACAFRLEQIEVAALAHDPSTLKQLLVELKNDIQNVREEFKR